MTSDCIPACPFGYYDQWYPSINLETSKSRKSEGCPDILPSGILPSPPLPSPPLPSPPLPSPPLCRLLKPALGTRVFITSYVKSRMSRNKVLRRRGPRSLGSSDAVFYNFNVGNVCDCSIPHASIAFASKNPNVLPSATQSTKIQAWGRYTRLVLTGCAFGPT